MCSLIPACHLNHQCSNKLTTLVSHHCLIQWPRFTKNHVSKKNQTPVVSPKFSSQKILHSTNQTVLFNKLIMSVQLVWKLFQPKARTSQLYHFWQTQSWFVSTNHTAILNFTLKNVCTINKFICLLWFKTKNPSDRILFLKYPNDAGWVATGLIQSAKHGTRCNE
jgi:hypothetical protein